MSRRRIGVLISGRGSNMAALLAATRAPDYPAEIAIVVSNVADAAGLETARAAGVATAVVRHRDHPDRESFDRTVSTARETAGVEFVCLAGFMRIFSPWFPGRWPGRILNIHPSLLPSFKGLHVQRQALEAGVRVAGCTVHFVTADLDAGPIVAQGVVPVLAADDEASLSARILKVEHEIYPLAARWLAEDRLRIVSTPGRPDRVEIDGLPPAAATLWRP